MIRCEDDSVLMKIPKYLFEETGIDINKIIQMYVDEDKIIINNPKDLDEDDFKIFER